MTERTESYLDDADIGDIAMSLSLMDETQARAILAIFTMNETPCALSSLLDQRVNDIFDTAYAMGADHERANWEERERRKDLTATP